MIRLYDVLKAQKIKGKCDMLTSLFAASGNRPTGKSIFDFENPNIANGYISSNQYNPYSTNGMIYVPIEAGKKYNASGVKRSNPNTSIRYATLNVANPNAVTNVIRTGQFAQDESLEITAESGETYLYLMFCGDSDYTTYGSVQSAYNANCPDVVIMEY